MTEGKFEVNNTEHRLRGAIVNSDDDDYDNDDAHH